MANDTIVAGITAPGDSAVAVTRVSGPRALELVAARFRGRRSPLASSTHRILFGSFLGDDGAPLDTVLVSVFRSPHSYTGEDVAEISSHGGAAIPRAVFDALVLDGARPARPGEFTERAYRNGKLDLAQAEAVAALVKARSERASRAAEATLGGALSRRVSELDRCLVPLLAEVEARIDFPGDVDEEWEGEALADRCAAVAAPLRGWLEHLPAARRREQGLRVALVGRPNVGKSSLMNALLGFERAIVSEVPGTTRDTVEESIWLDGVEVRLCDAAGVREPSDALERLGIERAGDAARRSDLAILVLDRSDPHEMEDRAALDLVGDRPVLVAWNKADLAGSGAVGTVGAASRLLAEVSTVAVRPGGAEPLRDALRDALLRLSEGPPGDELPTTSARQEALLTQALEALNRAERGFRENGSYDLIAVDLTDARRALGEIVGRGVDQDVIASIFSQFCIGK